MEGERGNFGSQLLSDGGANSQKVQLRRLGDNIYIYIFKEKIIKFWYLRRVGGEISNGAWGEGVGGSGRNIYIFLPATQ